MKKLNDHLLIRLYSDLWLLCFDESEVPVISSLVLLLYAVFLGALQPPCISVRVSPIKSAGMNRRRVGKKASVPASASCCRAVNIHWLNEAFHEWELTFTLQ